MYQIINQEGLEKLRKNPQVILKSELIELIRNECSEGATSIIEMIEKCPTYTSPSITSSIACKQGLKKIL